MHELRAVVADVRADVLTLALPRCPLIQELLEREAQGAAVRCLVRHEMIEALIRLGEQKYGTPPQPRTKRTCSAMAPARASRSGMVVS